MATKRRIEGTKEWNCQVRQEFAAGRWVKKACSTDCPNRCGAAAGGSGYTRYRRRRVLLSSGRVQLPRVLTQVEDNLAILVRDRHAMCTGCECRICWPRSW